MTARSALRGWYLESHEAARNAAFHGDYEMFLRELHAAWVRYVDGCEKEGTPVRLEMTK